MALAMVLVLVLFRYSSPTGPDESRVWGGWVGCVKVGLDGNYFPIRHIFMTCYDLVLFSTLLGHQQNVKIDSGFLLVFTSFQVS